MYISVLVKVFPTRIGELSIHLLLNNILRTKLCYGEGRNSTKRRNIFELMMEHIYFGKIKLDFVTFVLQYEKVPKSPVR